MATTLTIFQTTPYAAQLKIVSTDTTAVSLKISGATGNDKNISDLAAGPLRACLQNSADWTKLGDRLAIRRVHQFLPVSGNSDAYETPVSNAVALDLAIATTNTQFIFNSLVAGIVAIIELRFLHSTQR